MHITPFLSRNMAVGNTTKDAEMTDVWFPSSKGFFRCYISQNFVRTSVLKVYCSITSLCPEALLSPPFRDN